MKKTLSIIVGGAITITAIAGTVAGLYYGMRAIGNYLDSRSEQKQQVVSNQVTNTPRYFSPAQIQASTPRLQYEVKEKEKK